MRTILATAVLLLAAPFVGSANAAPVKTIDGIVLITQADALAGGVTAGDAPGFPVTITQSGSYRLGGPLTFSNATQNPSGSAINVTAPLVTLDLNGFSIDGNGTGYVGVWGENRSLSVIDGTIRNVEWGVYVTDGESMVMNIRVANSLYPIGIYFGQSGGTSIIRNNIAINSDDAIECGGTCLIVGNIVTNATRQAIKGLDYSSILDNVVSSSIAGIDVNVGATGRNTLTGVNTFFDGVPGSLGPNVCRPVPNPVPAGC